MNAAYGDDPRLFIPGPVNTSTVVKEAMARDIAPEDPAFSFAVADIRQKLVDLAGVSRDTFTTAIIPGGGAVGLEAVISSVVPREGKLLIPANGGHARYARELAGRQGIETVYVTFREDEPVDAEEIAEALERDAAITHVYVAHCETASGIINPVGEIGAVVDEERRELIVDSVGSFGGLPLDLDMAHAHYLVGVSDMCLESAPGLTFVVAQRDALEAAKGRARTSSLDLWANHDDLERGIPFRFTPPTHLVLGLRAALDEFDEEGGVEGRGKRYAENHMVLMKGMISLGFVPFLLPEYQSYIVTAFRAPEDTGFDFDTLYEQLCERGMYIARGTTEAEQTFRIACIGQLFPEDLDRLVQAVEVILRSKSKPVVGPSK